MLAELIIGISEHVQHVHRAMLDLDPTHKRRSAATNRILFNVLPPLFRGSEVSRPSMYLAIKSQDKSRVRATEPSSIFDKCFEHRFESERRAADHLEHFAGRRLLL